MKSENEIEVDDDLIAKYISGEANPEEAITLNNWLQKPANKAHFKKLDDAWNALHPLKNRKPLNEKDAWQKMSVEETEKIGNQKERAVKINTLTFRIAASLLFIIIAGLAVYIKTRGPVHTPVNIATAGNTKAIKFSDSSKVTLYHNTSITYPKKFNGHSREVNLIAGEAFFSIMPSKQNPFIIHTAFADITVVGTEFNVVVKQDRVEVGVNHGIVLFSTKQDSVYLKAGVSAIANVNIDSVQYKSEVRTNTWAYATKRLVFRETPLSEVLEDVEKAFDCSVSVSNDKIKNCKLTATFDNDSAVKIVNLIAETLNLSLKRNGQDFTLEGEGCP